MQNTHTHTHTHMQQVEALLNAGTHPDAKDPVGVYLVTVSVGSIAIAVRVAQC